MSVVPLNEIPINLQSKEIKEKVRQVGMKQGTDEYTLNLIFISQLWEVFWLELVKRTVPAQICLGVAVVIAYEDDEHDDVGDGKPEIDGFNCFSRKENADDWWGPLREKFIGLDKAIVFQFDHGLFIDSSHFALRVTFSLFVLIVVVDGWLLGLLVLSFIFDVGFRRMFSSGLFRRCH